MTAKNKIGAYFYTGHRINPSHKDDEPSELYLTAKLISVSKVMTALCLRDDTAQSFTNTICPNGICRAVTISCGDICLQRELWICYTYRICT